MNSTKNLPLKAQFKLWLEEEQKKRWDDRFRYHSSHFKTV